MREDYQVKHGKLIIKRSLQMLILLLVLIPWL